MKHQILRFAAGLILPGLLLVRQNPVSWMIPVTGLSETSDQYISVPAPTSTLAPEPISSPAPSSTSEPTRPHLPTPAPETTPVQEQTPEPVPAFTQEPITEERISSGIYDSYFDDAVFIGDSLTKGFYSYVRRLRSNGGIALGKAGFMGTAAMSVKNACRDLNTLSITFTYRGKDVSITEGIKAMKAQKAFILLGLNDISCRKWEDVEGYFSTLIEALQKKCPETQIIIQGVFPVPVKFCRERGIRIAEWNTFNDRLRRICESFGVEFYDFSQMFMDSEGYMRTVYSDGGFHLSPAGDEIWLHALRVYAAQKLFPDAELLLQPDTEPVPESAQQPAT